MANVQNPRENIGTQKKTPQQQDQWNSQKADQRKPTDKEYEKQPNDPFRPESDPGREVPDVQGDNEDLRQ